MKFCLAGSVYLLLGIGLLLPAGCGGAFRADEQLQSPIPETNTYVASLVVRKALEDAGIPDGGGADVLFSVSVSGTAQNIMATAGPEFLMDRGYTVSENREGNEQIPECIISVDTLYVNLDRDNNAAGTIVRYAAARIKAELTRIGSTGSAGNSVNSYSPVGIRNVYVGTAEYRDSFPRRLTDVTGTGAPYVNLFPSRERMKNTVRPLLFGTITTALVWLLYSYRG